MYKDKTGTNGLLFAAQDATERGAIAKPDLTTGRHSSSVAGKSSGQYGNPGSSSDEVCSDHGSVRELVEGDTQEPQSA